MKCVYQSFKIKSMHTNNHANYNVKTSCLHNRRVSRPIYNSKLNKSVKHILHIC